MMEEMGTFVASIIRNQPCMEFSLSFQNASGEAVDVEFAKEIENV
jgi:hypothetical protein